MINLISFFKKCKDEKNDNISILHDLVSEAKVYVKKNFCPWEDDDYPEVTEYYQISYDGILEDEDLEPSFSQMLFKFIKQQGISETDCYKNANIDRKLFSKIRSDDEYQPKKTTVFAFIIGLKLNLDEAKKLLECAGYSLSHSKKQDIIIEYAIKKQIYDINMVNEILYTLECQTLGSKE